MQILKFFKSLLPSFEKSTLMEDLRIARDEIVSSTLPPYETAVAHFDSTAFADAEVKGFDKELLKAVRTRIRGNSIRVIYEALQLSQDHLTMLESLADDQFSEDIVKQGMSYLKANILQTIQCVAFVSRYSRTLLNWILVCEAYANKTPGARPPEKVLKRPELKYLNEHKQAFFHSLGIMLQSTKDLEKTLKAIPNMIIEEENFDVAKRTVGLTKLDPLEFNLLPMRVNIFYGVGMIVAEWQASRFKAAKEERKLLELRLLQLREEYRESPNAKLQENIEYNQERLDKVKYKLVKLEEKYA